MPAGEARRGRSGLIDRRERMLSLLVSGQQRTDAIVDLPYELAVAPAAPAPAEVPS